LLSDLVFHAKNITLIINILIENDFLKLILISLIIESKIRKKLSRTNNLENNKKSINPSWFTLCTDFNRKIFKQFNRNDIKIFYYGTNKLKKFIKVHNINPLDFFSKSNVVYKINCNDYASYVGQTGRKLKTRISEYRNHIRWIPV